MVAKLFLKKYYFFKKNDIAAHSGGTAKSSQWPRPDLAIGGQHPELDRCPPRPMIARLLK